MKTSVETSVKPSGRGPIAKVLSKVVLTVVAIGSLAQTSCTDREIISGMAGAAVGAIIVGSAHSQPSPPPRRCGTTRREICTSHRDYWGVHHSSCRWEVYNSCSGGYHRYLLSGVPKASDLNANSIASKYSLSFDSADRLVAALAQSESGDPAGLSSIGLERQDVQRLANFQVPEASGVDRIARSLNQAPAATQSMLQQLVSIAKAQDEARREAAQASQTN